VIVKKHVIGAMVLGVACMLAVTATAQPPGDPKGQPPGKGGDGKGGFGQGKGGFGQPGGKGGFGQGGFGGQRTQPGTIMSTFMQDQLKLTDDQKKQVADLQKEVEGKLEKILTDEQKAQLKQIKEAGAAGGAGGFGGRPGGNPPPKKDPN
jgi:Spy/CpxP family protein refolding chaperone